MSLFLDRDEVSALTGKQRKASQRAVLNALGIQHKVRPDGTLLVLRAHVEKELGGAPSTGRVKAEKEPNWGAIGRA